MITLPITLNYNLKKVVGSITIFDEDTIKYLTKKMNNREITQCALGAILNKKSKKVKRLTEFSFIDYE